ncbi:tetratricopeptide repeat protein [Nitrosopumilus sp. K4]|uniref:M57 family metalloprotease n=1 Tax=Nitrosopumilus sp. K4 TaxID=2795383 RepID=UPI001BAA1A59|nr:M57 family metalloprotease [Nitrosopumilus sp. K4]QUC65210.1 tetratricopeptide repeat protein [Nitrosopumilus sp. K4]
MIQYFVIIGLIFVGFFTVPIFAQTIEDAPIMFEEAKSHFENGDYNQAITIYDEILEIAPDNISTLKMKGIAQSNLGYHEKSLKQFFKILQYKPDDAIALTGMGVGFGNLGEYQESLKYFKKALQEKPNSIVVNNYKEFIERVISKYPYTPTEKPQEFQNTHTSKIPDWVRNIAGWWADDKIEDSEFVSALTYLIENKIVQVPSTDENKTVENKIPDWIKDNAGWWADDMINDQDFVAGIQHMMENGILVVKIEKSPEEIKKEKEIEFYYFEKYLRSISKNVDDEKRYIEYPNPSQDVIKKFLRDYVKWNFEEEVKNASSKFPNPTYEIIDEAYVIHYKVYVNEQPSGLPLDHVSTLQNSFAFWENQELNTNNQKARVEFEIVDQKYDANVWVTWVVRELGEGVLGHAHLGKGVVEVTLGDYNCDGSFQLYDVNTVEKIMTHELGHSIGLPHVTDRNNIMYSSMKTNYAYCLLS